MRTTNDLPDALFRKTKANDALRGTSMKDLNTAPPKVAKGLTLPLIRMPKGKGLNLKRVDFDDLLA